MSKVLIAIDGSGQADEAVLCEFQNLIVPR